MVGGKISDFGLYFSKLARNLAVYTQKTKKTSLLFSFQTTQKSFLEKNLPGLFFLGKKSPGTFFLGKKSPATFVFYLLM